MSGNREGGLKTAEVNRKKDPDFYRKIGKMGGEKSRGGGFAYDPELARVAGARGGKASRRGKATTKQETKNIQRELEADQSFWSKLRGLR